MTSTLKRLAGAEEGARPEAGGTQGTGCPLARAPLRGKDSARGRPPTPAGVARPARDTMGPAGRADGSGPAAGRERETGGGGRVAAEGRPRAGIGARLGAKGRGVPAGDPTKTQGALRPKPSLAGGARGERRWQVGSLELPGGAIMGGGVPVRPTRGRAPSPPQPHHWPGARPRPPGWPAPAPARGGGGGAGKSAGRRREGGDAAEEKVGFGSVSFYRVGCAPVRAGARGGRASGVPRGPGPAGRALRSQGPSPRLGSGSAARPLLPPPARPLARLLRELGLIWSRWRQGVGAAQPPLLRCQYRAHSPSRSLARSHAHPRAPPPPPRDQGSSPNSRPRQRERRARAASPAHRPADS